MIDFLNGAILLTTSLKLTKVSDMSNASSAIRYQNVTFENAYYEIEKLENHELRQQGGVDVHSGTHPVHGNIHIIIPPMGDGLLLLPFVIQRF
ncbi:hypothetical protein [Phyllobacterium myrsinacearum]|uniref:Uncharacterized protein n=1 Tax=Phyllobacterium myrsinacearum TaxID=28101 RepID=A0A839EZG6_9HYPH|nr:hypothetical protein [Phyllobacterium myrsinacearum]MBA8881767.1 hypothetical protein [Phyllobacterium myrsinacearum]